MQPRTQYRATVDATHDARRESWVASANGHGDFPLQNLPFGLFSPPGAAGARRVGVAIGDSILDLREAADAGLLAVTPGTAAALRSDSLNALMALEPAARRAVRTAVSALLDAAGDGQAGAAPLLHDGAACTLHLPARIGDYTDFYAGIHHATTVGTLFRPDNPLMPNYKYLPVGYHGRASSIRVSGGEVIRPRGQRKPAGDAPPRFEPCHALDYEAELAIWIGPGNAQGAPIPIGEAEAHIFGCSLLNDWSARDIQRWEYQPLGPFLAKNFASHVSPWIVTAEALAPFRAMVPPRAEGDPAPLPHLSDPADRQNGAFDVGLEVLLLTPAMRAAGHAPALLGAPNALDLYWTPAQMVAHHTSNGCNLVPGDLFGSGTISSPGPGGEGSLLEHNRGGTVPIRLPNGETRTFLEDGDEVILRGRCRREGFASIGFGEVRATVAAALMD